MIKGSIPPAPMYSGYLPNSPYPKRPSPPGSPLANACCYDRRDAFHSNDSIFCCCYRPADRAPSPLAAAGVLAIVVAYVALGAAAFRALEGDAPGRATDGDGVVGLLRSQTVERLWSITENLNILYRENWTKLAADEVLIFERSLAKVLASGDVRHHDRGYRHRWSFGGSFLYSLTLITTIGYGSVTPRTAWGKAATIAYALVGVPLMLLYLATVGDVLARAFRRAYARLFGGPPAKPPCRCANTRVPVTVCAGVVVAYVLFGAVLFNRLASWGLLEGSYFCFAALGTIGFGDMAPRDDDVPLVCACSAYILTGMAVVAMCFSLVQDEVVALFRFIGASCSRNDVAAKRKDADAVEASS